MDGMLNIELTQRKPVLRVNSVNGYDFYVTDDNYILPTQRYYSVYVPVVTGMIVPPFGPDFVGSLDRLPQVPCAVALQLLEKSAPKIICFWLI